MVTFEHVEQYLANTKKPVQLVKHLKDVKPEKLAGMLMVQQKYDGVFVAHVCINGEARMYSRTGKELFNNGVPAPCIGSDGVYIGEVVNDFASLEVLSGLLNPNRTKAWTGSERLMMEGTEVVYHDCLTLEEFLYGKSETPYERRYSNLRICTGSGTRIVDTKYCYSIEESVAHAMDIIAHGGEGIVIKLPQGDWKAGRRDFNVTKFVSIVHYDLLCTGVKYGEGKRAGQIAALEFQGSQGKPFYADFAGMTDEARAGLTEVYEKDPSTVVGKVWEVRGLCNSSTGNSIRLPKVIRLRLDKDTPDELPRN